MRLMEDDSTFALRHELVEGKARSQKLLKETRADKNLTTRR